MIDKKQIEAIIAGLEKQVLEYKKVNESLTLQIKNCESQLHFNSAYVQGVETALAKFEYLLVDVLNK